MQGKNFLKEKFRLEEKLYASDVLKSSHTKRKLKANDHSRRNMTPRLPQ